MPALPAVPAPRERAELPYASYLTPYQGELRREGDHDGVSLDGTAFEDVEAGRARFSECAFSSVTFTGGRLRRARFHEVWLHTTRWVGTDLAETDWLDAEIILSALAGVEVFSAELRRVVFHHCKFDSVNLRAATLRDVSFVDCLLRDVDFGGARLTGVSFPGSALAGARFGGARMERVDLRGATAVDIADGVDALRGATISGPQLLDLAPRFAHALGVTVRDD